MIPPLFKDNNPGTGNPLPPLGLRVAARFRERLKSLRLLACRVPVNTSFSTGTREAENGY
jgi:hypothetical protein